MAQLIWPIWLLPLSPTQVAGRNHHDHHSRPTAPRRASRSPVQGSQWLDPAGLSDRRWSRDPEEDENSRGPGARTGMTGSTWSRHGTRTSATWVQVQYLFLIGSCPTGFAPPDPGDAETARGFRKNARFRPGRNRRNSRRDRDREGTKKKRAQTSVT